MWRRKNCPGPIGLPDPVYWVFGRKPQPMGPILGTQRLGLCRPWSELAIYSDTLCPMISQLFFSVTNARKGDELEQKKPCCALKPGMARYLFLTPIPACPSTLHKYRQNAASTNTPANQSKEPQCAPRRENGSCFLSFSFSVAPGRQHNTYTLRTG